MKLFNRQPKTITYLKPGGIEYNLISYEAIKAPHTLIAGSTNCGKSTFIHSIMQSLLANHSPATAKIMLIDPKQIELSRYAVLPHCINYAETPKQALDTLRKASAIMASRYTELKQRKLTRWDKAEIYIIIDELADLMLSDIHRDIEKELQHILQLGRAAGIHCIAATQCPNRQVIKAAIVCNFTNRFGMRCLSPIESRQIIGFKGCEDLPPHGVAWYIDGFNKNMHKLPYITTEQVQPLIDYWTSSACIA